MTFDAEVVGLRSVSEGIEIELTNVRPTTAAVWRTYDGPIKMTVSDGQARAFRVGRCVTMTLAPRRESRRTTGK
jgi:hypothetical protein